MKVGPLGRRRREHLPARIIDRITPDTISLPALSDRVREAVLEGLSFHLRDIMPEGLVVHVRDAVPEGLPGRVLHAMPERVLDVLPERVTTMAPRRRESNRWLQFSLGLFVGTAAAVGVGMALRPKPRDDGQPAGVAGRLRVMPSRAQDRARRGYTRGRDAFILGRTTAVERAQQGRSAALEAAQRARGTVAATIITRPAIEGQPPPPPSPVARATSGIQALRDGVRDRWQDAVAEGKDESAEKQAELRRRYLEYTKRIG